MARLSDAGEDPGFVLHANVPPVFVVRLKRLLPLGDWIAAILNHILIMPVPEEDKDVVGMFMWLPVELLLLKRAAWYPAGTFPANPAAINIRVALNAILILTMQSLCQIQIHTR
jgi:hypothetical protein